ncbi:hypothetical protein A3F37_03985 [Candidatus Saccharibacteria bacterium RIFCSPHIGHO2_12_FULL_41_12]|nr:MAG: hypothetical protein A3F37_03985 [Candidatus Saccharibacteria bacterium RIFCSPHIGHO2_12_FULL_41_12]
MTFISNYFQYVYILLSCTDQESNKETQNINSINQKYHFLYTCIKNDILKIIKLVRVTNPDGIESVPKREYKRSADREDIFSARNALF